MRKHGAKVTFRLKRCDKSDVNLLLGRSNTILESLRPMFILEFLFFFTYYVATLLGIIVIPLRECDVAATLPEQVKSLYLDKESSLSIMVTRNPNWSLEILEKGLVV